MLRSQLAASPATCTALVVITACLGNRTAFAQRYDITYLGFPYGFSSVEIGDINNHGDVVGSGYYRHSGDTVPLLWRDGRAIGLPLLRTEPYGQAFGSGAHQGSAWGINEFGEIVGESNAPDVGQKAVLWPVEGGVIDLLGRDSKANAINDAGVVVGSFSVGFLEVNAFRWFEGDWFSLYPPMKNATGVNNQGQIAGYDGSDTFVWNNGEFTRLPSLGGGDWARDINDAGQIVGSSGIEGLPVIWENGTIRQLPHFGIGAWALSINEGGDVTGKYFIRPANITFTRSCIWRRNLMMDLNDLLTEPLEEDWFVSGKARVNDAGQIAVGIGKFTVGGKPVRLEPVDVGLTLWGIDPSRPGRRNTIEIHHVSPNGRVILLWGTTRSEPQPFEQCSGAMIDLADPRLAAVGVADANGVARITLNVPANVEGNYIFQAVDHTTCEVSPPAWALFKMVN